MALTRRTGQRFQASIWPGFVDAMTALLLVLMFVLTIFMIVQFMLRETITGQASELNELNVELAALAEALGMEQRRAADLQAEVGTLGSQLTDVQAESEAQLAMIASLTDQLSARETELTAATARITDFEAQVAALLAERDAARAEGAALSADLEAIQAEQTRLLSEQEKLQLALAVARDEVDAQAEAARLAAARREALQALVADLRARNAETDAASAALTTQVSALEAQLSQEEAAKLAEAAAAQALRDKLKSSQDELTAMTLALEEQRKRAEDTLTLLAAAETAKEGLDVKLAAALLAKTQLEESLQNATEGRDGVQATLAALQQERDALQAQLDALKAQTGDRADVEQKLAAALAAKLAAEQQAAEQLSERQQREALLNAARSELAAEQAKSEDSTRKVALLNQQMAALRAQLGSLQALLDDAASRDAAAQVQLESLGSQLNSALAQVAAEQRARADLEAAEKARLEEEARRLTEEAKKLENYRSEFFGRMREVLAGREGVRIVGDRFVFSSEVLFEPGSADLAAEGRRQIANVASILQEVAGQIPAQIDWIIRVDGHTDNVPLISGALYADNWELSQARALSVVRYMIDSLGFPPNRLAATGFGEYQPVNPADTAQARAQNRRIELKLTER